MNKGMMSLNQMQNFKKKVDFLDGRKRKELLSPEEILNMLTIKNTDRILDVGAGSGYLSIPISKKTSETVYALDFDQRMLEVIEVKCEEQNIKNIQLIHSTIEDIPKNVKNIDIVLASLVLHEVSPLESVIRKLRGTMNVGGQLLCLEYEKDEKYFHGPPMDLRIHSTDLEKLLKLEGFRINKKIYLKEFLYIIVAQKEEVNIDDYK